MAMHIEVMAPVCAVYDIQFRNVVEEHEPAAGEKLNGKVELDLADPPYNVRRDREEENAERNVFALEDMKHMAGVLGVVMKPGEQAHPFVLRCSLRFVTLLFLQRGQKNGSKV